MATCYDCMHYEICSIDGYVEPDKCTYFIKTPKVDVKEVVKAKWEEHDDEYETYYTCSACKCDWTTIDGTPTENNMNFCPNCGADMRGDTDESM